MSGPIIALGLWFVVAVIFVWVLRWFWLADRQDGENIPEHGPTRIISLDTGRKVYVGRSGARAWVQIPGFEVSFSARESLQVTAAFEEAALDARVYELTKIEKKS